MNDREWEQFWTWLKQNFQNEEGGHFREILEDIRQLYEGHVSISDIGASKFFLVGGFIVPPKESYLDVVLKDGEWIATRDIEEGELFKVPIEFYDNISLPRSKKEGDIFTSKPAQRICDSVPKKEWKK